MFAKKRLNNQRLAGFGAQIARYLPGRISCHRTLPERFTKSIRGDCKALHEAVILDSIGSRRQPRRRAGPFAGGLRTRIQEHLQAEKEQQILPLVLSNSEKSLFYPLKEKTYTPDILAAQPRRQRNPITRRRRLVLSGCGDGKRRNQRQGLESDQQTQRQTSGGDSAATL